MAMSHYCLATPVYDVTPIRRQAMRVVAWLHRRCILITLRHSNRGLKPNNRSGLSNFRMGQDYREMSWTNDKLRITSYSHDEQLIISAKSTTITRPDFLWVMMISPERKQLSPAMQKDQNHAQQRWRMADVGATGNWIMAADRQVHNEGRWGYPWR